MDEKEAQSKKPEDSDFQQQRLRAWQPLLTPKWVILTFFLIGVIFLPIGIAILVASRDVVEYSLRYDNDPRLDAQGCTITERHMGYNDIYGISRGFPHDFSNGSNPQTYQRSNKCKLRLDFGIKNKMKGPVFVYYKLTNFYQNHRRYVKSRSDIQLRGKSGAATDTTSCDPLSDIASLPIYPCGLIANSVFNDTFDGYYTPKGGSEIQLGLGGWDPRNPSNDAMLRAKNENSTWQKAGISWKTDRDDKFQYINTTQAEMDKQLTTMGPGEFKLPRVDDEDFIVWMRTAGLPTFKKLYRVIHKDFYEGDTISIDVSSVFPVSEFSGEKYVVISTTSWLGGKNDFLGVAYIVVGAICLFLAAVFLLKHCISPRPLGDMTYFNWPGQTPIRSKAAPRMAQ